MLIVHEEVQPHLEKVREFARSMNLEEKLERQLDYLGSYACHEDPERTRCQLYTDFAPHSFTFVMERKNPLGEYERWFNGGLIYNGPDCPNDGSFPALTVSFGDSIGWSVHT
jgi:hypothetical protein